MKFTDILYSKSDGIARIIINRPEVYNAIRGKTTDEMMVAMEDTHNDDSIRVLIIEGAGPNAFCSGRDQGGITPDGIGPDIPLPESWPYPAAYAILPPAHGAPAPGWPGSP